MTTNENWSEEIVRDAEKYVAEDNLAIDFAVWIATNGYHPEHYYKHEHFKELLNEFKIMNYILVWLSYEFIRPKVIWLWYYLINKL